ncbi:endonuclease V isoform X3 [Rosa chinensis]|uniref:endonuclease V isoform X3 n=1 Tax=Rosa chinensis TaxID=74649 RepID=UPI001AD8DE09|nr:endonuclease V isoform X3 [Rosa chinensis]
MESISPAPAESSSSSASSTQDKIWMEAQDELKQKLIAQDDFPWRSATTAPPTSDQEEKALKYVGGVDISYSKEHPSMACGTLVVLDIHSLQVVYEDYSVLTLSVPYVPGFLAFREAPVLLELLEKMKAGANLFYPQLLMVDGNGILHPRGFGLACHLGILANLPTIGIGKNSAIFQLHHVDGLTLSGVRQLLKAKEDCAEDFINLTGRSGRIWGVAMRSTDGSVKPIFISIGHRISLDTAIKIVKLTCKYRVPEPIRQADIRSREYLRKHQAMIFK